LDFEEMIKPGEFFSIAEKPLRPSPIGDFGELYDASLCL
jgi:hypothetical protein